MTLSSDDGNLFGDRGRVTGRQDNPRAGIDEVPTQTASEQRLGKKRPSSEARFGIDLPLKLDATVRALELPVERVLNTSLSRQVVLVPFDHSHRHTRIQFFEHTHDGTVAG